MKDVSRKISYLLRHNPENLKMDHEGWVSVSSLIEKLGISKEELDFIVQNNDKKRFGYSEDLTKIRAHQGHSSKLDLKMRFKEVQFPAIYYHGTSSVNRDSIAKHGLRSANRAYVHLSKDIETAIKVGQRHGKSVTVYYIDGALMKRDGFIIKESENGVILVNAVPPKYLKIIEL
jgi:putative RNA 2'-phosphotransferase